MKYIRLFESFINETFLKWFWGSKVVDKDGNPLLVYHGTTKDFKVFNTDTKTHRDLSFFNKSHIKWEEYGTFFTDNKNVSKFYYTKYGEETEEYKKLKKYYDNKLNDIIKSDMSNDKKTIEYKKLKNEVGDLHSDDFKFKKGIIKKCYLSIKKPYIVEGNKQHWFKVIPQVFQEDLSNYDGIIIKNIIEANGIIQNTYVVFEAYQIKCVL